MDGLDGSPGGVKYRAAYAANNTSETNVASEAITGLDRRTDGMGLWVG